jgi:ribosomal protein S18 acetylase RimI-like enzyme
MIVRPLDVRVSTTADLPGLAQCQIRAFPESLSSRLGTRFCSKMLEWYIVADRGVLIHAVDEGRIVGYCSGVVTKQVGQHGAATSIVQYAFSEFVSSFVRRPWLLFHPEMLEKRALILRNLRIKLRPVQPAPSKELPSSPKAPTRWGLVGIGVVPECRGRGLGTLLLNEFERLARQDGVDEVRLSVKRENERAVQLYQRTGWQVAVTGSDFHEMSKPLREEV